MTNGIESAKDLISGTRLVRIRLDRSSTETKTRGPSSGAHIQVGTDARIGSLEGQKLRCLVAFVMEVRAGEDTDPIVTVRGEYELEYEIAPGLEPTPEAQVAFAELNAVFNAWPYIREFIQSAVVRMGLPPITIPLYRISDHLDQSDGEPVDDDEVTAETSPSS